MYDLLWVRFPHVNYYARQKIDYNYFLKLEIESGKPLIIVSTFELERKWLKTAYC